MTRTFVSPPASPAARGREFGEAHSNEIANTLGAYRELFDRLAGSHVDVEELGSEAMAIIRPFSSDAAAEIEGIAAGAALPVWAVAALNARTEILARCRYQSRGECSTVVAVGDDDTPMLAVQTWDWHEELAGNWLIWTIEHPDGRVVQTLTEYGILGKIGVSSAGLGIMMNLLHHERDGRGMGVPVHVVSRAILDRATDLNQALVLVASAHTSASVALTILASQGGDKAALCAEINPGGPGYLLPDERGILIHTNHFLTAPASWGDRENVVGPDSFFRYEILERRMRDVHPTTSTDLLEMLASHFGGGGAICCHPDADAETGDRYATLATVSLDVGARRMTVLEGGPCERPQQESHQGRAVASAD
jgi:isopenicillin-N N-acyltransferase-like protein